MLPIPHALLADLPAEEQTAARQWWATLTPQQQLDFTLSWDQRADDGAWFGAVSDGVLEWHPLPVELVGEFVDPVNDADHHLFKQQLLEYVSNHEDIQFFMVDGALHICRAHPAARGVIRAGRLPADFTCPNADDACPMRRLLARCPGKDVLFDVRPARRHGLLDDGTLLRGSAAP